MDVSSITNTTSHGVTNAQDASTNPLITSPLHSRWTFWSNCRKEKRSAPNSHTSHAEEANTTVPKEGPGKSLITAAAASETLPLPPAQPAGAPAGSSSKRSRCNSASTDIAPNEYQKLLNQHQSVSTLHEFFKAWHELPNAAEIGVDTNWSVFRRELKPMWEEFPGGGRVVLRFKKPSSETRRDNAIKSNCSPHTEEARESSSPPMSEGSPACFEALVDNVWRDLVFSVVGEDLESSEVIVGCVMSCRVDEIVISVWYHGGAVGQEHDFRNVIRTDLKEILRANSKLNAPAISIQTSQFRATAPRNSDKRKKSSSNRSKVGNQIETLTDREEGWSAVIANRKTGKKRQGHTIEARDRGPKVIPPENGVSCGQQAQKAATGEDCVVAVQLLKS